MGEQQHTEQNIGAGCSSSTIHKIVWCQRAHFGTDARGTSDGLQALGGERQTNQQKTFRYVSDG